MVRNLLSILCMASALAGCGVGPLSKSDAGVKVNTFTTREGHAWFAIGGASAHAALDCVSCHSGTSFQEFACVGCHTHDQDVTSQQHVGIAQYTYASTACYGCHADAP